MPGREERLREPLLTDMSALVDQLAEQLQTVTDKPYAFFGHSMGAIVCYELARRLRDANAPVPAHLFLSARAAPQLQEVSELRNLDGDAFIDRLHELYGAVPEAIRKSTELQEVFLPILRADVTLLETYTVTPGQPLDCGITVFGGADDPAISATMLAGWQQCTSAGFSQHEFLGGHFFIQAQREAVVAAVVAAVSP